MTGPLKSERAKIYCILFGVTMTVGTTFSTKPPLICLEEGLVSPHWCCCHDECFQCMDSFQWILFIWSGKRHFLHIYRGESIKIDIFNAILCQIWKNKRSNCKRKRTATKREGNCRGKRCIPLSLFRLQFDLVFLALEGFFSFFFSLPFPLFRSADSSNWKS